MDRDEVYRRLIGRDPLIFGYAAQGGNQSCAYTDFEVSKQAASMFRSFLILFLITQVFACSIAQPHPDVVNSLRATRALGGVTVENQSRWTLPPFTEVMVVHADGRDDNDRLLAVQTGLAEHLQIAHIASTWRLVVHWPDPVFERNGISNDSEQHWAVKSLQATGNKVKRVADRDQLIIDVIHNADHSLVTRLTVDIQPWLRGRDWHDPVALTRAFSAVGATLTGS